MVTCYKNDGTQTDFGTQVAIEDIENPFCRYDGGDYTQGNKVKPFYGFYCTSTRACAPSTIVLTSHRILLPPHIFLE